MNSDISPPAPLPPSPLALLIITRDLAIAYIEESIKEGGGDVRVGMKIRIKVIERNDRGERKKEPLTSCSNLHRKGNILKCERRDDGDVRFRGWNFYALDAYLDAYLDA